MLRTRILAAFCLAVALLVVSHFPTSSSSSPLLRRVTNTAEETTNINPSVSGDGRYVAFESSANLMGIGGGPGFRAFRADLAAEVPSLAQMGISRAVAPAVSQDGSRIAFASCEDLLGTNADRNFEIFLFHRSTLRQITDTIPGGASTRLTDGNFQPSITDDGRVIAFSSNRNLSGSNSDLNFELVTFDIAANLFTQITDSIRSVGATNAKISGDGTHVAFIRHANHEQADERDLMLHDCITGLTTDLASNQTSLSLTYGRAISDDGLRVVYSVEAVENQSQVFLFDGRSGSTRQITSLPVRADDVPLFPTISGDGRRIAFATRRNPVGSNTDRSVELFLFDIPTARLNQLTNAPAAAQADVVASLNDNGSLVVFNFPRVLSGPVSSNDLVNNSEIYTLPIEPRPAFGTLTILNGASKETDSAATRAIAPDSIAVARGESLASRTLQAQRLLDGSFPRSLAGSRISVNGREAILLYVSQGEVHFVVPSETEIGQAEVILSNSEGFQFRTTVGIAPAAPGLFTLTGDGVGEGVILNADNLLTGPFDPTEGQLRLIVFGTGLRRTLQLSVTIGGQQITVESIQSSSILPGLDELHLLVPADLRGTGTAVLNLVADNRESNEVGITLLGSVVRDVLINEILADPPDGLAGDANHDGLRDSSQDEFIEMVNTTMRDIDLAGYQLQTRGLNGTTDVVRHRFSPGTILSAGTAVVVFGGGNPDPSNSSFGNTVVLKASTGGLSVVNSGALVTLRRPDNTIVAIASFGGPTGVRGDQNESLTRSPDVTGSLVLHRLAAGSADRRFSPGTRVNRDRFVPTPEVSAIFVEPIDPVLNIGDQLAFTARAVDRSGQDLSGVIFGWQSSNPLVATVDASGKAFAVAGGSVGITASARGVQSTPIILTILSPTPTPTPTPTPSPTPSASPSPSPVTTPTPIPSPTPSPTPVPTPTPSPSPPPLPSPSPTPRPVIVISEFRTRGPNGANDEFVELYNNSDAPIDVSGWKIRGSSNSGSVSTRLTISSSTAISPRGHLLFTNSNGYSGSVTADQTYSSGFANDGGVALTLPNDPVVDQVGMSPGSAFKEGVHLTPLPSDANQSYERKPGGAAGSTEDTNNNSTDFQLIVPSDPQNLSSRPTPDPSPSPSPTPSPSVSPSPSPTPSPAPSPTATPTPTPSPSPGPSPSPSPEMSVVISQVYGGGGNSGAPFRNDFIEIFNSGGATINLAGWSVQYATSTGATWSVTNLSSVSLNPGQYYLVQESSGGSNGTNLPSPDATGTIAMAATAGKVALVSSTTALSGACPSSSNIVDMVGYGTNANCFRGAAPAPAPSNTTSAARKNDGCTDSQNNSADFAIGPPNPRNTLGQVNVCSGMVTFALIRRETVSFNLSTPAGRTGGGALCPTHFSLSLVTTRSTLENSCHLEFIGLSDKLMEALIKSLE